MTINITSSNELFQGFESQTKKPGNRIISIAREPYLYLAFEKRDRGGQGLGRYHRIKDILIDNDNRVFAGIVVKDRSGFSYRLAPFGRLLVPEEEVI